MLCLFAHVLTLDAWPRFRVTRYIRVYVESMEAAQAAVRASEEGAMVVDGHVLMVSLSAGRVDSLFPLLPYRVRYDPPQHPSCKLICLALRTTPCCRREQASLPCRQWPAAVHHAPRAFGGGGGGV